MATQAITSATIPNYTALPVDEDLQRDQETTIEACAKRFFAKGGTLDIVSENDDTKRISLPRGAAVYPICSGGWCRSQSVWAFLKPYDSKIALFAPHAARLGWDPYNGRLNRSRNRDKELWPDEFPLFFRQPKALRAGFEHDEEWLKIEATPSQEGLQQISQFYDETYYGSKSTSAKHRIFIVFEKNVHVVMHRLAQSNQSLENVTLYAIDWTDTMTKPAEHLQTHPRSALTYKLFADQLSKLFDLSLLNE